MRMHHQKTGGNRNAGRNTVSVSVAVLLALVMLAAGDRIPADLRMLQQHELQTDDSMLTGESQPVRKHAAPLHADTELAERSNMAWAGTTVVAGQGSGLVIATGDHTETGRIAGLIAAAPDLVTPLTRKMVRFSNWLLWAIGGLAALTFAVGLARGETAFAMFMAAVALAVGASPAMSYFNAAAQSLHDAPAYINAVLPGPQTGAKP